MDEAYFKKISTIAILAGLIILSFFLLKPLLLPIIVGFILAFIFSPVYNLLYKLFRSKNLPSFIICIFVLALIVLPIWFFLPTVIDESIKFYRASQGLDIVTPLKTIFPSLFSSNEFSQEAGSIIHSALTNATNSLMNYFSNILIDLPQAILQIFVVFFTFFYTMRDKDRITSYIKSLIPFSKEIETKLFDSTRDLTFSILFGYIIVGIMQGLIQGIGFFVFGVPNAFILLILAIVAGILPIIGPAFVGIPVAFFLVVGGDAVSAIGILIFTAIASLSDHIVRPILVSKRTNMHPALVLIGMVGGFILLGVLGIIIGPLVIAYLIIIMEVYRKKNSPSILIQENK